MLQDPRTDPPRDIVPLTHTLPVDAELGLPADEVAAGDATRVSHR